MEVIKNWFLGTGMKLNAIYGAVILFVFLSFFMSGKYESIPEKERKKVDHPTSITMGIGFFALASFLAIPSVLLYTFDGMAFPEQLSCLTPLPFSELMWFHKVIAIAFGILFLILFLTVFVIDRDHATFWSMMSLASFVTLACILFLLAERGLKALLPDSGLLDFAISAVHMFLQFYAYIGLIFMPFAAVTGPFLLLIPGVKNASSHNGSTAEQRYADSLDARERAFNAATGTGFLTNDEAYLSGKIDANEWAPGSILRDEAMDKFKRK